MTTPRTLIFDKIHYSWCAGFFDGEGSTSFHSQNSKYRSGRQLIQLSIAQVHKGPLTRFKRFIGNLGHVKGPYGPYSSNKQPYYQYYAAGKNARKVLRRMWPFLSVIKKTQASVCLGVKNG